jgi:hypothetical protein
VRINVPENSDLCWKTLVEVTVGNGSPKHFLAGACVTNPAFSKPRDSNDPHGLGIALAFEPLGDQAISCPDFWEATSVVIPPTGGTARRVLRGIQPGKYLVNYGTGNYWRDDVAIRPPLSKTAEVQRNMQEPLRFRLPAASVEVEFEHPKEDEKRWRRPLLAAVAERGTVVRQECAGYADNLWGNARNLRPHLDFVPPGRYTLVAWESGSGWARSGPIEVGEGKITNGGVLKLQRGGTIKGRIALPDLCAVPDRVVAVDSRGLRVPVDSEWTRKGYTFAVHDLWRGKWTLHVLDDAQNVIVEKNVELKATETVDLE